MNLYFILLLSFLTLCIAYLIQRLFSTNSLTRKGQDVLLVGPSNAGKTALYYTLSFGRFPKTQPSMMSNSCSIPQGLLKCHDSNGKLSDVPGHPRLAFQLNDLISSAICIIFVLDSATLLKDLRSTSEYLYNVLTNAIVQIQKIPVLVVCNKSDIPISLPVDRIKMTLQKEFEQLRSTTTADIEVDKDSAKASKMYLGVEGKSFNFGDLMNRVDFVGCSVKYNEIDPVKEWLKNIT